MRLSAIEQKGLDAMNAFDRLDENLEWLASREEKKVFTSVMQDWNALAKFRKDYHEEIESKKFVIGGTKMELRDIVKSFDTKNNTINNGKVKVKNWTDLAIAIQLFLAVEWWQDQASNAIKYWADGIIGTDTKANIKSHQHRIEEIEERKKEWKKLDEKEVDSVSGTFLENLAKNPNVDFFPYVGKYVGTNNGVVKWLLNRSWGLANVSLVNWKLIVKFSAGDKVVSMNMWDYGKYINGNKIKVWHIWTTLASWIDKYFVNKEKVRERLMTRESIQNWINKFDCKSLAEPLNRYVESLKFNNLDNDGNVIIDIKHKYVKKDANGRHYAHNTVEWQLKINMDKIVDEKWKFNVDTFKQNIWEAIFCNRATSGFSEQWQTLASKADSMRYVNS